MTTVQYFRKDLHYNWKKKKKKKKKEKRRRKKEEEKEEEKNIDNITSHHC